jgi:integrase
MATIRKRNWTTKGTKRSAWVCDYFDQAGTRRLATFGTRREAEAWSVETLHQVAAGTHTAASVSITVGECFRRWIEHCEAEGLEFGTIRQRRQHLQLHIENFIGRTRLADLTLPRVHQFDAQLRDAGRSLAMRRKIVTNLGTAIKFAQSQGLVAQNVVHNFTLRRDDRGASGPLRAGVDFPTKAELKAMLDNVNEKHRAFIATLIFTGMRISEARGLTWGNVDLAAGVVHIRQRADAWGHIGPPKSKAGSRDIPLAPMAANALRKWRPACPKGELNLVFPNRHGRVQTLQNLRDRVFLPLQKAAGISKPYGFHSLRHAFASLAIEHFNWQPKQLQAVLGHASAVLTFNTYGHLFRAPEAGQEAMKRLEAAIAAA